MKEAIDKFDSGQDISTIIVQQGEHRWDNFLEIGHTVNVRGGSNNALLPVSLASRTCLDAVVTSLMSVLCQCCMRRCGVCMCRAADVPRARDMQGTLWMKKGSAGSLQTIEMAKSLPPQVPLSVALAPFPRIFRRRCLLRTRALSKDFLAAVAMGLGLLFVLPAGSSSTPGAAGVPASIPHAVHGAEGGASPPSGLRAGVAGGPETAMEVTVPGHYSTFKEAIDKFDSGQDTSTIIVQQGEHRWDNFLEIGHTVNVRGGSNNALLPVSLASRTCLDAVVTSLMSVLCQCCMRRCGVCMCRAADVPRARDMQGTLWMKKGSAGSLQTIEMAKDSGSCIIFEGGAWR